MEDAELENAVMPQLSTVDLKINALYQENVVLKESNGAHTETPVS
jgi:hypothetical protein